MQHWLNGHFLDQHWFDQHWVISAPAPIETCRYCTTLSLDPDLTLTVQDFLDFAFFPVAGGVLVNVNEAQKPGGGGSGEYGLSFNIPHGFQGYIDVTDGADVWRMAINPELECVIVEPDATPPVNARQALCEIFAAHAGQLSGATGGTGAQTITIKGGDAPGTTRVVAEVDGVGNRTGVTLTLPP